MSRDEAFSLLDQLRNIGARSVLITSIRVDRQTAVVGYNHHKNDYFILPYTEIPVHFPGTGDIFSAILVGNLLKGTPLRLSTRIAMDIVARLIDLNKDKIDKNRGIPIENYLSDVF